MTTTKDTPPVPLPRTEDGFIETSAEFGEHWMVEIEWATGTDGKRITEEQEEAGDYPKTFHGPFDTEAEGIDWVDAYPEDMDVHDMRVIVLNKVRGPKVPR